MFSGALIYGAYYYSTNPLIKSVDAESTEELLKVYAVKDSDKDGLTDWEEALYGTDPTNAYSVKMGVSDQEAVSQGLIELKFKSQEIPSTPVDVPGIDAKPDTITDKFARELFAEYLTFKKQNVTATPEDLELLVTTAMESLVNNYTIKDAYSLNDVARVSIDTVSLEDYATSMSQTIKTIVTPREADPLQRFSDALVRDDKTGYVYVKDVGAVFTRLAAAFIKTPVPTVVASSHLELANAMNALGVMFTDMSFMETDPLRGMVGISQYDGTGFRMAEAFASIGKVFTEQGVSVSESHPGYTFYRGLERGMKVLEEPITTP